MTKKTYISKKNEHSVQMQEPLKPQTRGQADYIKTICDNTVTICTGPAGTGKSYVCLGLAAQELLSGKIDKIVIARPTIETSKKSLGALPGTLNDKLNPYLLPAIMHLKRFLGKDRYLNEFHKGNIVFAPLEYMRGSTYNYSFIILEEAQNADVEQLKMFITRIGKDSKIVINGDVEQTDLIGKNGIIDLKYVIDKIHKAKLEGFGIFEMTELDIVRHPIIGPFLRSMK